MLKINGFLSFIFLVMMYSFCLFPSEVFSFEFPVAVKSIYKSQDSIRPDPEIVWHFDDTDKGTILAKKNGSPLFLIKKDSMGIVLEIESLKNIENKGRANESDKRGRSKPTPIFFSDGHPAPFDWINPQYQEATDISFYKTAGGLSFKSVMKKEIAYLSYEKALSSGFLNQENLSFVKPDKKLVMFTITKAGRLFLNQLWQEQGDFWLYERTDTRTSYRIKR